MPNVNGNGNGSQQQRSNGGGGGHGHRKQRGGFAAQLTADRIRAWEKIFNERGMAIIGTPECPQGYAEWAKTQGWNVFEPEYQSYNDGGYTGTPSTALSDSASVPETRDDDDDPPRRTYRQEPGHRLPAASGGGDSSDMLSKLVESVIRSNDRSAELAALAINKDYGRREWTPYSGKRQYYGQQQPGQAPAKKTKLAKDDVSPDDAARLVTRIDCRVAEYVAGGRPPNLSNRDLLVITEHQRKLIADETARRVKRAEQAAEEPASGSSAKQKAAQPEGGEEDGEGEEEQQPGKEAPKGVEQVVPMET